MGEIEFGKCECCGKEATLQRTYFIYDIKCECHSPNHFELKIHCSECKPNEPVQTKVSLKTSSLLKKEETNVLIKEYYWNDDFTIWEQPPVPIKVGDLVDIKWEFHTILGRYIGNGIGAAVVFPSSNNRRVVTGYVVGRGLERNPKLPSNEELFEIMTDGENN